MENRNPFLTDGKEDPTVEGRLSKVRNFSLVDCNDALKLPSLQKTVRKGISARIKALTSKAEIVSGTPVLTSDIDTDNPIGQMSNHITRAGKIAHDLGVDVYQVTGRDKDDNVLYLAVLCFDETKAQRISDMLEEGE